MFSKYSWKLKKINKMFTSILLFKKLYIMNIYNKNFIIFYYLIIFYFIFICSMEYIMIIFIKKISFNEIQEKKYFNFFLFQKIYLKY